PQLHPLSLHDALPISSTPRIAVWRKLKRLGAAQLLDGLVALPLDSRNREQLEWIANDVTEAGGMATIWIGRLAAAAHERQLAARDRKSTRLNSSHVAI